MRSKNILCLSLVLNGTFFSATIATAQPVFKTYYSVEARVAQAQSVFCGTISDCSGIFIEKPGRYFGGYEKDGTMRPDGVMKYMIAVQVGEVIKGEPARSLELVQETYAGDKRFEQSPDRHASYLFFIGDKEWSNLGGSISETNHWSTIPLRKAVSGERDYGGPPVYSMDFAPLSEPNEILMSARRFAKSRFGKSAQFYTFARIPNGPLWSSLVVPVTPPLEKTARQMIESGNRAEGILALRYFKSAKNIKLLKPLLNDPAFSIWQTEVWNAKQVFGVRQSAYEVLQEWGVNVPKPVMEVKLPWKADPSVRQKLKVQLPTRIWIHRTTNTFEMGSGGGESESTNVLVGSNMIAGVKFEWFVYPDGEPRPASAARLDLNYWATPANRVSFNQGRDGLPVPGQKYIVEADFVLFETDNPPLDPDSFPLTSWRPQDGKNYRVLFQRTLEQASE